MTLRVAFDARSLRSPTPRGWDRYILELVARLPKRGIEPWLIFEEGKPLSSAHTISPDCQLLPIRASRGLGWEQVALPLALRRFDFDVYHAPAERGVPFAAPCPVLLTLHSLTHRSYRSLIRKGLLPGSMGDYLHQAAQRRAFQEFYAEAQYRAADHIAVPSEFCRDELLSLMGLPASKVTVTRLGLPRAFTAPSNDEDVSRVLQQRGIKKPYVLYVGGYERHKNVPGLLDVAQRARARLESLSFVLVGTGTVPDALRHHTGASSKVHFLSNVNSDLVPLYDGAAAMLTMSWRESFCLPALEAMSRGVPVVASSWGAVREVIGETGALVDPRSPERACEELLRILATPVDHEALHRRALAFTWDETVRRTSELYQELRVGWGSLSRAGTLAARGAGVLHAAATTLSTPFRERP